MEGASGDKRAARSSSSVGVCRGVYVCPRPATFRSPLQPHTRFAVGASRPSLRASARARPATSLHHRRRGVPGSRRHRLRQWEIDLLIAAWSKKVLSLFCPSYTCPPSPPQATPLGHHRVASPRTGGFFRVDDGRRFLVAQLVTGKNVLRGHTYTWDNGVRRVWRMSPEPTSLSSKRQTSTT